MRNTSPASERSSATTNQVRALPSAGSSVSATSTSAASAPGFPTYSSALFPRATPIQSTTASAAATTRNAQAAEVTIRVYAIYSRRAMLMTDADLVVAARSGDRVAIRTIHDTYCGRLFDHCSAVLRDPDTAGEVLSETFMLA